MKKILLMIALTASCRAATGNGLTPDMVKLQQQLAPGTRIGSIVQDTLRDDDDNKYELFKFYSYQDENDINFQWRMRVTVQMTDRKGESCFAQINRPQGPVDTEYTGEDTWEFHVPHGAMDRPQVSAYIIQYGVLKDGVFVPVAEKLYRAEALQELLKNPRCRVEFTVMRHYYNYREAGEILSSQPN